MLRYITIFIILTALGIFYEKYKLKYETDEELDKYDLVKKFLLNDATNLGGKPILWVHSTHEVNARYWPSFYSRNTTQLNQPYLLSCLETIVKHCGNSFNICLIDDSSFEKLIPGWSIHISQLAEPLRKHTRMLAMSKLLYYFGGLAIPNSMIVLSDLQPTFQSALANHCCCSVNMITHNITSTYVDLFPNNQILGCKKNSPVIKEYMLYLERLISRDYTDEMKFLGDADRWLYQKCKNGKMALIQGAVFGVEDIQKKAVTIERLMGSSFIQFSPQLVAIYVPADEILSRTRYQWFARLSQQQLRTCDTVAAKYLLIAQNH